MQGTNAQPERIPSATYRLQFNRFFTFRDATALVGYLHDLGITHIYASPFLMARPGSLHGYDVTDPTRFNPEIGDANSFAALAEELRRRAMSMIVDVVPNHMCISHPSNVWWWDVLQNGPSSPFARFFDIDWHPPKEELANKVLLPVLGDQFGRVLENEEIKVVYPGDGQLEIAVNGMLFPLAPCTWPAVLDGAALKLRDLLGAGAAQTIEFQQIVAALAHLAAPTETDETKIRERPRDKDVLQRRLRELVNSTPLALEAISQALAEINGKQGDPRSFDRLESLLEAEPYRLSYWRVAANEINYRRFFDINDLAAIRIEDPDVFSEVHSLVFEHVRLGQIAGLRIDHPDGLLEPEKYFRSLDEAARIHIEQAPEMTTVDGASDRPLYVVAEKILTGDERLRNSWPIDGTTGYDFLNLLNGLFVDRTKEKALELIYRRFTGWSGNFPALVADSKRLILQVGLSSELNVLARQLDRLSRQHRWFRDFTFESLRDALAEVLASFPVYRTYVQSEQTEVDEEDRRHIVRAIEDAKARNPAINESVFDFLQQLLLLQHPAGLTEPQRGEREAFTMRFQQLTAPVMAKGVEDTAFYRYHPLASLNEVGGSPDRFGFSPTAFHRRNLVRQELWPHSMSATSTHDSKRSEDTRARIDVLSEIPQEWYRALRRWTGMLRAYKTEVGDAAAPDPNEEYLFYQALVGTWPLAPMNADEHASYTERLQLYMRKALNEAKVHSSWVSPNREYLGAVDDFVAAALRPSRENEFIESFRTFQDPVARAGIWNAISQLVLKIACPGVPEFYQGSELWNFALVDPDNRGLVDYELRTKMLSMIETSTRPGAADALLERLVSHPCDGAIKMYVTRRALRFRRTHHRLFELGSYTPLAVAGTLAEHAIAFARSDASDVVIAAAGRFYQSLCNSRPCPPKGRVWEDTGVILPSGIRRTVFREVFTGIDIVTEEREGKAFIPFSKAFQAGPFALLFSGEVRPG